MLDAATREDYFLLPSRLDFLYSCAQIPMDTPLRPYSSHFDEHYWSGGAAEKAYVFLGGNDLPTRFAGAKDFTVGELGFGTGLNFLLAWELWERAGTGGVLTFVSHEAFPLGIEELKVIHRMFPAQLQGLSRLFLEAYEAWDGWNGLGFGRARLRLYKGDVATGLVQQDDKAGAWFLDGFSPAKNPAMWTPEVLKRVGELTDQGGTATTYTVAAAVREGLRNAGFEVQKTAGFPPKEHMLKAVKPVITV